MLVLHGPIIRAGLLRLKRLQVVAEASGSICLPSRHVLVGRGDAAATLVCAERMHGPQAWPLCWNTYMPHHTVSHAGGGGGGVDDHDDGAPPPPPPAPPGWTCLSTQGHQAWSVHINSGDPRGIRRGSEGIRSPNRGSGLCRPYALWGIRRPQSSII